MKTVFMWGIGITAVLTVIVAAMPALLRRRGVAVTDLWLPPED